MNDDRIRSWKTLFLRVLNGDEADLDLEHIGGMEPYVRRAITRSDDPAEEKLAVIAALDFLFEKQPLRALSNPALAHMLDLAAAFQPEKAVAQLLAFLQQYAAMPRMLQFGERQADLRLRALQALENYFPASPLNQTPGFASYRRALHSYQHVWPFRGYVVARICELDGDVLAEATVSEIITALQTPELADLLRRVIQRNVDPVAQKYLAAVFHLLDPFGAQRFNDAVALIGGRFQELVGGAGVVYYPDRDPFTIQSDLMIKASTLEGNKTQYAHELWKMAKAR